jgi:hypothetical protein
MGINFAPEKDIASLSKRIKEADITDDGDLYRMVMDLRDLGQACAAIMDIGADTVFTTLWKYDKGKRFLGRRRPHKVVAPIRHFASGMRFGHRFMMKVLRVYRKQYAEEITLNQAGKSKSTFNPGRK